jgi:hypothetical protein
MALGRPTKYKKQYCKDIVSYFKIKPFPKKLPTLEGFAIKLGVTKKTLHNWAEKDPDFLYALKQARERQHEVWLQNTLSGKYNATFAKFLGGALFGYSEKTVNEITGSGGESLKINVNFVSPDNERTTK